MTRYLGWWFTRGEVVMIWRRGGRDWWCRFKVEKP